MATQPDQPIIATLTSADGRNETYLTARDTILLSRGLELVLSDTIKFSNRIPSVLRVLDEVEMLNLKLQWAKGPTYV